MKVVSVLASASVTGVLTAAAISGTALAWHPKGVITKSVQNVTANGSLSDANDAGAAVAAKTGDVLNYVIVVSNQGATGDTNAMYYTQLTDTLPAGVELVSNPSQRTITEDLGTIQPGQSVTKQYQVKVTSQKDGDLIENQACFTGDSQVKDNPQKGCDIADVKVSVPAPTPTPTPTPTPPTTTTTSTPAPTALPNTGASDFLAPAMAVTTGGAAYAGRMAWITRRRNK